MTVYISATEKIYREISKPSPRAAQPTRNTETTKTVELKQDDVDAILRHSRSATMEELQCILAHPKEFSLSPWQRDEIRLMLSIAVAAKSRQARGIREDRTPQFLASFGIVTTPVGLLHNPEWFAAELRAGTQAIASCRNHQPPLCQCWRQSRHRLYNARQIYDDKSPEAWAALQAWELLEEIELSSRPVPGPGLT